MNHFCEMRDLAGEVCGDISTRFVSTTFEGAYAPWQVHYWLCDTHLQAVEVGAIEYTMNGRPIVSAVLKQEF